jgi:hypothetical protein
VGTDHLSWRAGILLERKGFNSSGLFAVHAIIVEFQDSGRGRYGRIIIKIGPFGIICNIHCWYYNPLATSFNGVGNMPTTLSVAESGTSFIHVIPQGSIFEQRGLECRR